MSTRRRKTHIAMTDGHERDLFAELADNEIRLPEILVTYLIEEYTEPGAIVFDPFAGFGTVLIVAERLGRVGYGIEIDADRAAHGRTLMKRPERLVTGDARELESIDLPAVDLVLSSPPYMNKLDILNPLTGDTELGSGYEAYVLELAGVYGRAAQLLRPLGHLVIEVANLKRDGIVTTLAWDLAAELSKSLTFEGETIVAWDKYGYGYDHSYCLAFTPTT